MADEVVVITIKRGEDYSAHLYWTDDEGSPVPAGAPARMDVRDGNGALIVQFDSSNDPETRAAIIVSTTSGILQLTCPKVVTRQLPLGTFPADLFARQDGGVAPFESQETPLLQGYVQVVDRTTRMEEPAL